MAEEILVPVGDLYANLHAQFAGNLGEDYEAQLRQEVENFLHRYNQQIDRRVEQNSEEEQTEE